MEETIGIELQHIKQDIKEIKIRLDKFEQIFLMLKENEHVNRSQDERKTRAEDKIKEDRGRIERLEKDLEDLREKPVKDKAEIINTALKYAGMAVLGGAVAFVLSKVGVLFQ
jgi:predicted RNase H-like nuclease (RuvC/YqgF family)